MKEHLLIWQHPFNSVTIIKRKNIYKKTAIHRFATVDEIVDAYRFCIDNPFVNGSLIEVNGGYSYK